jgi:hypothetical protein
VTFSRTVALVALGWSATLGLPSYAQNPLPTPTTVLNGGGGGNCTSTSGSLCAESYTPVSVTLTNTGITDNPTTYNISDSFNQGASLSTESDFGASVYLPASSPKCPANPNCINAASLTTWNFQDNYQITTPLASSGPIVQGALVSTSYASTIGLTDLQARIVAAPGAPTSGATLVSQSALTIVDGWQTMTLIGGVTGFYEAVLNSTALQANTSYVLEIRGEAASAASYGGTVTFSAVPLPASFVSLLSGLAAWLLLARRRGQLPQL